MNLRTRSVALASVLVLALSAILGGCAFAGLGLGSIPARPVFSSVYDGADALGSVAELQVGAAARAAAAETGGEVVVVTVRSAREFGERDVYSLSRRWFEAWRIGGTLGTVPSRGKGVLLLVALDDRDARIELGRGFSSTASSNARRIMQDVIVPHMKRGDVEGGIEAGAEALARLETRSTPFGNDTGFLHTSTRGVRGYSAFGFSGFFGGGLFALALLAFGIWRGRWWLAALGVGVLVFFVFTKVVLVALLILALFLAPASRMRGRNRSRRRSRRVWSSGRGATGSW